VIETKRPEEKPHPPAQSRRHRRALAAGVGVIGAAVLLTGGLLWLAWGGSNLSASNPPRGGSTRNPDLDAKRGGSNLPTSIPGLPAASQAAASRVPPAGTAASLPFLPASRPASPVERPPNPECTVALRQGLAALQREGLPAATRAFERAVKADPSSALARDYLGMAYLQQHRLSEASRQFREEIRLEPTSANGWARLADVAMAQEKLTDAVQALEKAVALSPDTAQLYFNLGMLYPRMMELGKAVEALQRCLALQPENHYAHYLLGNLLYKLTRLDEAEQELQEAIRLEPRSGLYHFGLAQVFLKRESTPENTERARAELARALELGMPEPAAVHYHLGICYQRQEKWELARQELETSVRLAPKAWSAYYALQEVLRRLGRVEEAGHVQARFRALRAKEDARMQHDFYIQEAQRNPNSPSAHFQLAEFLARTGDRARAREELARAKRLAAGRRDSEALQRRFAALAQRLQQNGGGK